MTGVKRRFGKLTISEPLGDTPMINEVFGQLGFFPWHAEFKVAPPNPHFYMMGTSPLFREVPQGHAAPDYTVQVTDVDGVSTVSVIEQRAQAVVDDGK